MRTFEVGDKVRWNKTSREDAIEVNGRFKDAIGVVKEVDVYISYPVSVRFDGLDETVAFFHDELELVQ